MGLHHDAAGEGNATSQVPETKNRSLQDIERDLDLPERLEPRGAGSPNPA